MEPRSRGRSDRDKVLLSRTILSPLLVSWIRSQRRNYRVRNPQLGIIFSVTTNDTLAAPSHSHIRHPEMLSGNSLRPNSSAVFASSTPIETRWRTRASWTMHEERTQILRDIGVLSGLELKPRNFANLHRVRAQWPKSCRGTMWSHRDDQKAEQDRCGRGRGRRAAEQGSAGGVEGTAGGRFMQ
jgi:hypothetical protein